MAQFDVYKNTNQLTAKSYPLLLDVQHSVLDTLATRIVIPLCTVAHNQPKPMEVLMPLVEFENDQYVLMTPQLAAVSVHQLRAPIGTLAAFRTDIISALDFSFTGY